MGPEGKGRCGWQSRREGPPVYKNGTCCGPEEGRSWRWKRVPGLPQGLDGVCPASCSGVGMGEGVGGQEAAPGASQQGTLRCW